MPETTDQLWSNDRGRCYPVFNQDIYLLADCLMATLITAHKRSLGQGNIFTSMCHSFYPQGRGECIVGGCVVEGTCMAGVCMGGDMYGRGCAWQGMWLAVGVCQGWICMAGGIHGREACVAGGVCMAGRVCMARSGLCIAGDIHGKEVWMGGGRAWQERWPLKQVVCILLECIHSCYYK